MSCRPLTLVVIVKLRRRRSRISIPVPVRIHHLLLLWRRVLGVRPIVSRRRNARLGAVFTVSLSSSRSGGGLPAVGRMLVAAARATVTGRLFGLVGAHFVSGASGVRALL
jgi:hypothetical protein